MPGICILSSIGRKDQLLKALIFVYTFEKSDVRKIIYGINKNKISKILICIGKQGKGILFRDGMFLFLECAGIF